MAASASHGSLDETVQGIHRAYQGSFANAAARNAATGFPGQGVFTSNDVGKLARQLDNNTLWILTAITPTWVQIGISSLAASAITNTPAGNIAATDVQAALNELDSEKALITEPIAATHIANGSAAHAASAISNVAAGNISSTTVQTAINELDTEKAALASAVMDGDAAGGSLGSTFPNPTVVKLNETSGPTALVIGAVADGEFLKRVGSTLVSSILTGGSGGGGSFASSRATRTSGDESITSTTFADLPSGAFALTITTAATRVLVSVLAASGAVAVSSVLSIDVDVDGVRMGGNFGLASTSTTGVQNLSFSIPTAVLSAGSHTFTIKAKTDFNPCDVRATANFPLTFCVQELP